MDSWTKDGMIMRGGKLDRTTELRNHDRTTELSRCKQIVRKVRPQEAADKNCMDVPLLDNSTSALFNTTHQTAMERPHIPPTPSDPATAIGATQDIMTTTQTIPPTTSSTLMSNSSASPTSLVSLQNTADPLMHTDTLEILSLAPPRPVLDDIAGTSPWPTSAPELGTAKGSPKAGSRKNTNTPDSMSVDCATHANTAALDLLPQPPPQPTAIDIAIAYSSEQGLDVKQTSVHLPHTSHG
ncbi:hypothetical protein EI94DRAFT_1860740 [Lactarius quietus]|nr:hypothetical protein EI94DRAFT_1860740 [Lactarius quietus]